MHGASCLHQVHRNGSITDYPQRLGAAMLPPDCRAVMPLLPEPIVKHDGTKNNAGARHAAKRCVATVRQAPPHLTCLVTADRLRSKAPHIETLQAHDLRAILGVKEGDQAALFQQGQAAEHAGRGTYSARHDRAAGLVHRFRFVNAVPLHAAHTDVRVNGIAYGEIGEEKVQHCSWVTDRRVHKHNVYRLMRGGRARWKIATETCHTLQNQGYNFAHHYGHGQQHLSVVFAMLMLLACVVEQTQQRCGALFRAVWAQLGSKRLLWERRRALFYDYQLASLRERLEALFYGGKQSRPD